MPTISNYNQFAGTHWVTGSVRNYLAQRGFKAPHTGDPFSEAFLLGISGGITVGYFVFAYEGHDPQCNILTRNTFDPLDTMLSRLGGAQYFEHTRQAKRAVAILEDTLAEGQPAIVWADMWHLPYNAMPIDEEMWGAFPLVVYGYEPEQDTVYIADRARVPLQITIDQLAAARGRIKKNKFRLLTLDPPNPEKLVAATRLGICDMIRLFTEKPPKGSKNNFGLNGLQFWAKMLGKSKQRLSWSKQFPAGLPLYAGLTSAFNFAFLFGKGEALDAERGMYADFLDEAAVLLNRPGLKAGAAAFRTSGERWAELATTLLPDSVAPFGQTRALMVRKHQLFLAQGGAALSEIQAINQQLVDLRQSMIDAFPLTEAEAVAHRAQIAERVLAIHAAEKIAVETTQAALD